MVVEYCFDCFDDVVVVMVWWFEVEYVVELVEECL